MAGLFESYNPIQRLAANQYGLSANKITKGSLISFHYPRSYATIPNVIHDPYPMVILTDIWPKYIRGLNLHYLTFPYIKRILGTYGGQGFSYFNIKPDAYMAQAFRMYFRVGVRQPKRLDTDWLIQVLQSVRSFSPGELENIRANIQRQMQHRLQAKVDELTSYEEWRARMSESQKRQFRGKGLEAQRILTGGMERGLIKPTEGFEPPTIQPTPGEGGPYSTEENI
jgi:hypothetical protein